MHVSENVRTDEHPQARSLGVRRGLELELRSFMDRLGQTLPPLISYLCSDAVRKHPKWGELLPTRVRAYGEKSMGHCIRPDIVMTEAGPKVCELDFVPSGRGVVTLSLEGAQRESFLQAFANWYRLLGCEQVAYATGEHTTCWEEQRAFCEAIRELGVEIEPVNVDRTSLEKFDLVDRLFYRSELVNPFSSPVPVITAEPFLDSKAVLALVHDEEMTGALEGVLGEDLLFLRSALAETIMNQDALRAGQVVDIVDDHKRWVIKNTDVETTYCWGSRGTVIGGKYTKQKFARILDGEHVGRKNLGDHPAFQKYHKSIDFCDAWNEIVDGSLLSIGGSMINRSVDEKARLPATKHVHARVGAYILIDRREEFSIIPSFGVLTLRQDQLVHGAADALFCAFELV